MFSSENHAGRLVELRVSTPTDADEIEELKRVHIKVMLAVDGQCIVAVDMRGAMVFPPGIADHFIKLMSTANPKVLRSAILVSESAVLGLQAERAIQEAGGADRKVFRQTAELEAWLDEVLDAQEMSALRRFLDAQP
ncbi:MAG: hypothetical protein AAGM22_30705 [Acidobacteriota bacterium]